MKRDKKSHSNKKDHENFKARRQIAIKKALNKQNDQIDPEDHCHLLAIVPQSAMDYTSLGGGQAGMDLGYGCGRDCSSGCKWYLELAGGPGRDWGVCANPKSHRVGLLTFEHQGCAHFEHISIIDKKYDKAAEVAAEMYGRNEMVTSTEVARRLKISAGRAKKIMRGIKRHLIGYSRK